MGMPHIDADSPIALKRDAILARIAAGEAIRTLGLFSALVASYTLLHALSATPLDAAYAWIDACQVAAFGLTALALQRKLVPERYTATVIMCAVVIGVSGQTFDYIIDGERWAILIAITMSGTVVLEWGPFWIGSIATWSVPSLAYLKYDDQHAATWILGTLVAVIVAANTVHSRRRTATELALAQASIEQLATVDPMTALLNRRGFSEQARLIRGAARRTGQPVFAVFVDVGGLKRMNDTYGHATGDALIKAVAAAVARNARETDLACRWGGDEFLIVGVGERPDPEAVNERLLSTLDRSALPTEWRAVLWTGSAQSRETDESLEDVIVRADADLYSNRSRSGAGPERSPRHETWDSPFVVKERQPWETL